MPGCMKINLSVETRTDIFFYAIDGSSNQAVNPLDLDKSFGLDDRRKTSIIGITVRAIDRQVSFEFQYFKNLTIFCIFARFL